MCISGRKNLVNEMCAFGLPLTTKDSTVHRTHTHNGFSQRMNWNKAARRKPCAGVCKKTPEVKSNLSL